MLLNELIETASFDASKKPAYSHDWMDNNGKNNWDYWTTYVQDKNGAIWEATLNVANAADGRKILYDIGPIKKVGQSVKSDTSLLSTGQRGNSRTSTVKASVAENTLSVKGQYSLTQATEGRKMNSRARRDVNQTMNAVQTELRGLIEAETRAARDTQKQVLAELAQTVLDGKNISQEQINDAFETVWNAGRVVDRSAGEAAWDVKEYLRTQGAALSEADQALTARRRRCSI